MTKKLVLLSMALSLVAALSLAAQNFGGPIRKYDTMRADPKGEEATAFKAAINSKSSGGPDAFGYKWKDSDEAGGPAYNWIDITGTGTALGILDDNEANITIPFSFEFYGVSSSNLRIGNNGGIIFNATSGDLLAGNLILPTTGWAMGMVAFWDDIDDNTGDVYWEVQGAAPNRMLIVEWYNRPRYNNIGSCTFEIILYETSNVILFQYADVNFGNATYDFGASATVGIQGSSTAGDSLFLAYSYNSASLHDSLAIRFDSYTPTTHDLTVASIDTPSTIMTPSVAFTPAATINNPGLSPESDFQVFFQINDSLGTQLYLDSAMIVSPDSMQPGSSRQFAFSEFIPAEYTSYTAVVWTGLADDYSWNDTLSISFRTWDLDVAASSIITPGASGNPDPDIVPRVTFHNAATQPADFTAHFKATYGGMTAYDQQVMVAGLAGGADTIIEFPVWPGIRLEGTYNLTAYSEMDHDLDNSNDTLTANFLNAYNVWYTWTPLATATAGGAHAGYEGKLYMFGGYTGSPINQISIYDTVSASWSTSSAVLSEAKDLGSAVAARGKIFVMGGEGGSYVSVDCYSPDGDSLNPRAAMPSTGLGFVAAVWRDSLIYRIGGYNSGYTPVANVEIYDIVNDAWVTSPTPLPVALAYSAGTILGDTIIISTGTDGSTQVDYTYIGIIDPANPDSIVWSTGPAYPAGAIFGSASGRVDIAGQHGLLVAGGYNGTTVVGTTYMYTTADGWSLKPDKTTPFYLNAGSQVGDYFVVAGGYNGGSFFTCNEALWLGSSDKAQPVVTGTTPANNTTGVHLMAPVIVSFSKSMDTASVAYTCNPDPAGWTAVWNGELTAMTLSHNAFEYSTDYNCTVTAGSSLDGYAMVAGTTPNPFAFTTWNPGSVIQDQMGTGGDVYLSQIFEPANSIYSSYMADDIDVSGFDSVQVSTIEIMGGYWNGHTFHPVDSLYLCFTTDSLAGNLPAWSQTIWSGNVNLTGYDEIGLGSSPSKYVMYLDPPVTLAPGKSWMIWAPYMNLDAKDGQCGWVPNLTIRGIECSWRNPGGGFGVGTDWIHTSAMFTSAADAYMKVFGQTFTGVAGNPLDGIKPVVYSLASAYPNPLKDRSNIKFGLPRSSHVEIEVYNIAGQRIKTLVNANLEAGYHSVYWNGRNDAGQRVANGVYVYRMNSGSFQATKKLLILK